MGTLEKRIAALEGSKREIYCQRNQRFIAASDALRDGVKQLPEFEDETVPLSWRQYMAAQGFPITVGFSGKVCAMSDRIDASTLTDTDKAMLDSLPACELSPVQLVQLFAEIEREF